MSAASIKLLLIALPISVVLAVILGANGQKNFAIALVVLAVVTLAILTLGFFLPYGRAANGLGQ